MKYDGTRIDVDVKAVNNLMNDLKFSNQEATMAVRSALRDSINIMKKAVVSNLSRVSSDRQKRKGVRVKVYKNASGAQVNVYTPFYITRDGKQRLFILRWLEEGTKESRKIEKYGYYSTKNGRRHGATPAKPFFNPAITSSKADAERALSDNILKRIEKIVQKRSK